MTRSVAVVVRVSNEASQVDDQGATSALVETLIAGLEERGLRSQLFTRDDDNPPSPRIEIWIEKWDTGNEGRRDGVAAATALSAVVPIVGLVALGQLGAEGKYSVLCRIYREGDDNRPAFEHRHDGGIYALGGSSASNGESVGNAILRNAFSDAAKPKRQGF